MNIGEILNQAASGFSSLIADGLARLFGPGFNQPVLGPVTWSDFCVTACLVIIFFILHAIAAVFFKIKTSKAKADDKQLKGNFYGALGKPLWLLTCFGACFRWLQNREDSPWYPSLRQFRQPALGDWDPVLFQVRDALREFAQTRSD